ncbi:MAG: hypothetical protein WCJ61_14980 [Paludibacter sp.]
MESLNPDTCYNIYNHANGFENVFNERENYRYFLEKYQEYIGPIAETYSYCLMPNHFHLVVRMRKREVIEEIIAVRNFSKVDSSEKVDLNELHITDEDIEKFLSKQFSNLFSSYTQSYNKYLKRMGSLFIKNFKREPLFEKEHFINEIMYTHRNPVHHGFRIDYDDWEFSSYYDIASGRSELVEVDKLLKVFGGKEQFIALHSEYLKDWKSKFI